MVGETSGSKPEPFGRLNRKTIKKPALVKPHKLTRPTAPQINNTRLYLYLYLYLAGGILFLVLSGYALAA